MCIQQQQQCTQTDDAENNGKLSGKLVVVSIVSIAGVRCQRVMGFVTARANQQQVLVVRAGPATNEIVIVLHDDLRNMRTRAIACVVGFCFSLIYGLCTRREKRGQKSMLRPTCRRPVTRRGELSQ